MSRFLVFVLCGFGEMWLLLSMWGIATPINAVPFVALVGCLTLIFVAAPLALFFVRLSAAVGILSAAVIRAWPAIVWRKSMLDGAELGALPITALIVGIVYLWRSRHDRWLAAVAGPPLWARAAIIAIPVTVFVVVFDARAVLALILAGAP